MVQLDPHAIHIWTDGSCYRNQRMISGCAAIVEYPDSLKKEREQVVDYGCSESSINRMELLAIIRALQWIRENRPWPQIARVQIISDSTYAVDCSRRSAGWRSNGWRNRGGRPLENVDLLKELLSALSRVGMTVHIEWTAGKKSPVLKEIDKAAKRAASRGGPNKDYGYAKGRVSRSMVKGAATLFHASGQSAVIRPYRKNVIRRAHGENKIRFDLYFEKGGQYVESCYAFASPEIALDLHSQHLYRVRFDSNPEYPHICEIVEEVFLPQKG